MRKTLSIIVGILAAAALLLTGCRPELDFSLDAFSGTGVEVSGTAQSPTILFSSDAGKATVVFNSSGRWSAAFVNDRAKNWCSLSAEEGRSGTVTLTVTVRQNEGYDERSASIVFTCDNVQRTLVVTQKQLDALVMDASREEIPAEGGSFTLNYRTNVNCQVKVLGAAEKWITLTRSKALNDHSVQVTVQANGTMESRQGEIEVKGNNLTEIVTVYQEGEAPTLVLGAHAVSLPVEGDGFSVQVTSNMNVVFTVEGGDWLQEVKTKTLSTNTYYFAATANTGRAVRLGRIVFRADYGMRDTVVVTQDYQPIVIDPSPRTVPCRSVVLSVLAVDAEPGQLRVETATSWLSCTGITRDKEGSHILIETQNNTAQSTRQGTVLVYMEGCEGPDELIITQEKAMPFFSFTTTQPEVSVPAMNISGNGYIHWGDGTFENLWSLSSLVHRYSETGTHTVIVEAETISAMLVDELEEGMHLDFSNLK